ncbi:YggS family pyridoxal phosphate-dependent enzyme [Legionella spiritensis]|uniref:YggS family pyridoxal phosphate-dependent enzyme n=1 Tax=Legionella spiritensis TaxID=452 RepID=UPI000F6F331B|nr:YggS family pyridoxal phosphate-dependent enzyme [Legionella spiritensis]VEG92312.1 pyridoxal-5'-phosphate dependent enzyme family [Legionella spiritensis]
MTIADRILLVQQSIIQSAKRQGRNPGDIRLIAVSKGQPATAIQQAFACGLNEFGENYWQEAKSKIDILKKLPIIWHFIGLVQSNKAADIATHFDWVHTVDREKTAAYLARYRPADKPPLNVCIQINLDDEPGKSGIAPAEAQALATFILQCPTLRLRGLMAIPKPHCDEKRQYQSLLRLARLLEQINQQYPVRLDTLSMGMSDDLQAAIRAGSTMVRVGRAIFGERG